MELPSELWETILNYLTINEKPEIQLTKLAFISSVSKQVNSICKKHKQHIGIQTIVVQPTTFQTYFASSGYLSCMIYAYDNGCQWNGYQWNDNTCASAALNGHLECLRYAHKHGCQWNWLTCSNAASNGHLECLKYAHEHGCEWTKRTCAYATKNGHLECLKYAHENGCPCEHCE